MNRFFSLQNVRRIPRLLMCLTLLALTITACATGGSQIIASGDTSPLHISVWTYYNGPQLSAFSGLVEEFNRTEGKTRGIVVESFNLGSVEELQEKVTESIYGKVGADPVPNVFSAYADTAYNTDKMGMLADISEYLDEAEQDRYIDIYLEEGRFDASSLKIFPIAKSTEVFLLNQTDWEPFAKACGKTFQDLETLEGLVDTAALYYEWSGGKALYGRDAMANYMLIGAMQLGTEIVSVQNGKAVLNFNRSTAKKLWDHYYVPFVRGYFASSGRFRSDDVKTGNILGYVGSSSGATYFPEEVTLSDDDTHPIEMAVLPVPRFANGKRFAVQQGAGMVIVDTTPEEVEASVAFLKWFTDPARNIPFAIGSCYMPVMKEANNIDVIASYDAELDPRTLSILTAAMETVNQNTLYTPKAFDSGTTARSILEYSMSDLAVSDRHAVLERVNTEGLSPEEAVAPYLTDDYFDAWYRQVNARLQMLVN